MTARSIPSPVLGNLRVLGHAPCSRAAVPGTTAEESGVRASMVVLARGVGDGDAEAKIASMGQVRNLALGERLDDPGTMELLYCDGEWKVLARHLIEDVAAARALVEHSDSASTEQWRQLPGTRDDALAFYDQTNENSRCSFCSKRAFQVAILIEGASGIVCNECVARFRRATQAN